MTVQGNKEDDKEWKGAENSKTAKSCARLADKSLLPSDDLRFQDRILNINHSNLIHHPHSRTQYWRQLRISISKVVKVAVSTSGRIKNLFGRHPNALKNSYVSPKDLFLHSGMT